MSDTPGSRVNRTTERDGGPRPWGDAARQRARSLRDGACRSGGVSNAAGRKRDTIRHAGEVVSLRCERIVGHPIESLHRGLAGGGRGAGASFRTRSFAASVALWDATWRLVDAMNGYRDRRTRLRGDVLAGECPEPLPPLRDPCVANTHTADLCPMLLSPRSTRIPPTRAGPVPLGHSRDRHTPGADAGRRRGRPRTRSDGALIGRGGRSAERSGR